MADKMMGKFNKYWSDFVLILAISVILDPRYISFCGVMFKECYPETSSIEIMKVRCKLFSLFDEYADKITTASSCSKQVSNKSSSSHENAVCGLLKEFDTFQSESPDI